MQNVLGARGDFVHYQGVWRLQPLQGCAEPGAVTSCLYIYMCVCVYIKIEYEVKNRVYMYIQTPI